jgi:uncharacterized membrane protein YcaP (DUF421 family)
MRQEAITEEELLGELRLQGVEDPAEVREATSGLIIGFPLASLAASITASFEFAPAGA